MELEVSQFEIRQHLVIVLVISTEVKADVDWWTFQRATHELCTFPISRHRIHTPKS